MKRWVLTALSFFVLCNNVWAQANITRWSNRTQAWQQGVPWCPGGEVWAELTIPAGGAREEVTIQYGPGVGIEESVSADLADGPERYHAALTDGRLQWLFGHLMEMHRGCSAGGNRAKVQCISIGQAKRTFQQAFSEIVGADGKPKMVDVPYNAATDRFTQLKLEMPRVRGNNFRPGLLFLGARYNEFYRWDIPFTVSPKRYGPSAAHCRYYECDYLGWNGSVLQSLENEVNYGLRSNEYRTLSDGAFVPVCGN